MSAPLAAEVLRELGAQVRIFSSVRAALLWYRDQFGVRLRVNRDLAAVTVHRSRAEIEQTNATFAAIANCLRREHETDPEDSDLRAEARYLVSGEMLVWLVAWYENDDEGDGSWLASRADRSTYSFIRRCKNTERVLRRRLQSRGLLKSAE